MKKTLIVIGLAAIFLLTGCNNKTDTEKLSSGLSEICINSVIYYRYYSIYGQTGYYALTPKFTTEGKIVKCSNSIKKSSPEINSMENSTPKVN